MPHDDDDGSGGFGRAPSNPVADTGGGGGDDDDGGRTPSGGPSAGAGGDPRDDDPSVGGDPTDDAPSAGEPGGTPDDFGDGGASSDNDSGRTPSGGPSAGAGGDPADDNAFGATERAQAISEAVSESRFANDSQDIAIDTSGGEIETELTGDAAQAQQRASDLIENNPAADSIDDVAVGDGDASVTQQAQRDFEREQTLEQTVSESPFADEADDVAVTFEGGQAQTDLAGDAARAQQQANRLLASNPAADSLSDLTIGDGDASVTQQAQRDFEREQALQQTITSSPFADEADDVAVGFEDGDAVTSLTADAADARQQAEQIIDENPAADSLSDLTVDTEAGAASITDAATEQFEREQERRLDAADLSDELGDTVSETDARQVIQTAQQDDVAITNLADAPALASQIESVTGVDAREVSVDEGTVESVTLDSDGFGAVVSREQEQQQEQQEDEQQQAQPAQSAAGTGLAQDAAAARANRAVAGVREQQQDRQAAVTQQQAATRAAVSRFGQQQLNARRRRGGGRRDENPLAADLVDATEDVARGETIGGLFRNPLDDLISAAESAERDEELVESATSGGLFAPTDARGGDVSAVVDPTDTPDGSVITGATGISEEDLARDTGLSEDIDEFIESAGETPPAEGGRPPSAERFPEQVVEGTATAASAIVNPEFLARSAERTAEVADPETVGLIADDPADAAATALDVGGETAVESAEQFARDPGTAVGGAAFTGLTAGAAGVATGGRSALSSATVRDAVTAELDPRIGPFGTTAETSLTRRIRGDGGDAEPDGGQIFDSGDGAGGDVTLTAEDIPEDPLSPTPNDADRRQQRRRGSQPPDVDDEVSGPDREQPRTVSRRDTTTVDVQPGERGRSGPTQTQREAGQSRRTSTFDIDLSPRERQLAAQAERPDRDLRVLPEVRFDDDLSLSSRSGARTPTLSRPEVAAGAAAGAQTIEGAQQRQEQAEAVLPGVAERTGVFDAIDTDAAVGPDIDAGVDTDPGVDTGVDTGIDVDTRVDTRIDSESLIDTDARVDPDVRDPSLRDPSLRDPDVRDPDRRDPDVRDPDLRDPELRDPDLDRPLEEDDDEPLFPGFEDDTAGVRDVEATLEGFGETPTGNEGGIFR